MQTIMRHYGAPTRLLDWTESPWVALFCACEDAALDGARTPGRVLCFDRKTLRQQTGRYNAEHKELFRVVNSVVGRIPQMVDPTVTQRASEWVITFDHVRERFPRLIAQQGLFTVASKPWLDHWQSITTACPEAHFEIVIDPQLKATAMRYLLRMGISAAALFPGIEGVARDLSARLRLFHVEDTRSPKD